MLVTLRSLPLRVMLALTAARKREEGQAMAEYALILFLVSVVSIGVLTVLGSRVSSMYSDILKGV